MKVRFTAIAVAVAAVLAAAAPSAAQVELTGNYSGRLYEDYMERGPGIDLGDYTGVPLTDDGRAKALLYTPTVGAMIEHQCLAYGPYSGQFRPSGVRIVSQVNREGEVEAWILRGDYQKGTITIWMDGRPHPSPNDVHPPGGFTTGRWDGNTLVATTTHLKGGWLERNNGIPWSDMGKITAYITRHAEFLTIVTVQEDPVYLSEPHVVSRVHVWDPRVGDDGDRIYCNTAPEVPRLEDSGVVPHYYPGRNPEADFMTRTYNIPKEAALGHAETLYPEYRKKLRGVYTPPASCGRYCCGWIERQGLPGGAPGLSCNDGGLGDLKVDRSRQRGGGGGQ